MQEAIGEEIAESRRFLMVTLWFGRKRDGYGTKDGGHDISCPYKARRWRCEVATGSKSPHAKTAYGAPTRADQERKEGGASLAITRSKDPNREIRTAKSGCATTRAKIRGAKYAQEKRWRPEGRRYDTKDGGHDIPAAARNLRYRAPT